MKRWKYRKPNLKVRFNKGFYGEYLSCNILEKIDGSKKILTNVYILKETGGTTEIDVIMIQIKRNIRIGIGDLNLNMQYNQNYEEKI